MLKRCAFLKSKRRNMFYSGHVLNQESQRQPAFIAIYNKPHLATHMNPFRSFGTVALSEAQLGNKLVLEDVKVDTKTYLRDYM
jgi:hypothetical protein